MVEWMAERGYDLDVMAERYFDEAVAGVRARGLEQQLLDGRMVRYGVQCPNVGSGACCSSLLR